MRPYTPACAALSALLLLAACQAPDIADWPPEAPPVDPATVESYVARYGHDIPPPVYTAEDLKGLALYLSRRDRKAQYPPPPELPILTSPEPEAEQGRTGPEIMSIKRRVARQYDGHHEQRRELRRKYGIY